MHIIYISIDPIYNPTPRNSHRLPHVLYIQFFNIMILITDIYNDAHYPYNSQGNCRRYILSIRVQLFQWFTITNITHANKGRFKPRKKLHTKVVKYRQTRYIDMIHNKFPVFCIFIL